ncbi:MAG: hypothetical protein M1823_004701 [Watsoniomyces obsoletus]|nr:MAG: hypothetical protein M1823_004701 [Watsoniomyces obsoletus]
MIAGGRTGPLHDDARRVVRIGGATNNASSAIIGSKTGRDPRWSSIEGNSSRLTDVTGEQRARDTSTTSVANAIRRGSVKISWPIPAAEGAVIEGATTTSPTVATAQSPSTVAAPMTITTASHGTKPPSRPARPDSGQGTSGLLSAFKETGVSMPTTTENTQQMKETSSGVRSTRVSASASKTPPKRHVGPAAAMVTANKETPPKKSHSMRSMFRRLLRRSTVKERRSTVKESGTVMPSSRPVTQQTDRSGIHHRSDPGRLITTGDGGGTQRKGPRSTSLPIKELGKVGSPVSSHSRSTSGDLPRRRQASATPAEEELIEGDVDGEGEPPWQPTSPSSQHDEEFPRPWPPPGPPPPRWAFPADHGAGGSWTGLTPRPVSGSARRTGSYSAPFAPEDIGVALSKGANPKRRSRSAGELQRQAGVYQLGQERRMSEEIRYWRESVTAQPLSPLIPSTNEQEIENGPRSQRGSYAVASSASPRGMPRSIGPDEPWTNADVTHLRDRISKLEGHVSNLQMTVNELMRRLAVQSVDDPSLAEVLHPGRMAASNRSSLVPGMERLSGQQYLLRHQMATRRAQGGYGESPVDLGLRSAFSSDKDPGSSVDEREREQDSGRRLSTATALAGRRLSDRPQTAVLLDDQFQQEQVKTSGERSAHLSAFETRRGSSSLPQLITTTGSPKKEEDINEGSRQTQDEPTPDETASFTASEAFITPTEDRTFGLGDYGDGDEEEDNQGRRGINDDEDDEDEDDTWNTNRTKSTLEQQGGLSVLPVSQSTSTSPMTSTNIQQGMVSTVQARGDYQAPEDDPFGIPQDEVQQEGIEEQRSAQRTMSLGRLTAGNNNNNNNNNDNNPPLPDQPPLDTDTHTPTLDRQGGDDEQQQQQQSYSSGIMHMHGLPPSPIFSLPSSMGPVNNTSTTTSPPTNTNTTTINIPTTTASTSTTMDHSTREGRGAFEATTLI